ncbi:sigma-54 dependent DNA-binding response regulator [Desulforapulum autotrophicum HRM2]|uniref:Sigma-54 dependent DNA-binding response regulator n=1 Tax=Desulforapulum autotrophicum (strain ATCC 43914 / DSM 3382 / VKM B-1955 / HRM2) TaxID=177437 RepID=C0QJ34_DESAH|nr:sigma-54 dependent transcriptional regulator [Desulforapulum autotrophicum]ACN13824.1 sigma-54 dependent DNA-binding response regulator [Desulforapulum autotrophicum HRM2]
MKPRIVIIDDEPITLKQLRRILEKEGYGVSAFSNPQRALQHLEQAPCDLVISDVQMPLMNGMDLMTRVKARFPDTEVILITGYASLDGAVEATKEGAFYYLEKPFTPTQVRDRVNQALDLNQWRGMVSESGQMPVIIGKSSKIREIVSIIGQIGPTDCNVMITGDSGSGKELVARAIHDTSNRRKGPFVAFNCGALTETLMDNELFGHEKGAFTGADTQTCGLLETATGGTLFIDEIGEMPQSMQVKLLRVLQEGELLRVGGNRPVAIDVRIVSATAVDVKTAVNQGGFRKDLYFRINVVNIKLPGLSERKEDIPLLAYHILNRLNCRGGRRIKAISEKAMALLHDYAFPGNVRELENILERATALCKADVIRVCDLPPDLIELELQSYKLPDETLMTLAELEQDYIAHLLRITGGVRTKTAEILGIDRASLWRKMKKYGQS